jgi:hypothetical protein
VIIETKGLAPRDSDEPERTALERRRQQRTERWIFIRQVAILVFTAAVVVLRFTLS